MNLAGTQFNLRERSFEVYLSGCKGVDGVHCKGCHNPQTWDFNYGSPISEHLEDVRRTVETAGPMVQAIKIYGGEPFDQTESELATLVSWLQTFKKELWVFTRRSLEELPEWAKVSFDFIKCGMYDETQKGEHTEYGVTLATLNQHIFKKGVDF